MLLRLGLTTGPLRRQCALGRLQSRRGMMAGRKRERIVAQVYGANTDVGKTIISAGLVRAALSSKDFSPGAVSYIKPLQTGGADAAFIQRHVKEVRPRRLGCFTNTSSSLRLQSLVGPILQH